MDNGRLISCSSAIDRAFLRKGRAFLELTKPRLSLLILLVGLAGFALGSRLNQPSWQLRERPAGQFLMLWTAFGIWLLAGGIFALNQYLERDLDAKMRRTAGRPLPSGRLTPRQALWFGLALSALAMLELTWLVNPTAGGLALVTWGSYLFAYTPLKTKSPLCTVVGAFPGAMPPLLGWAAARGQLSIEAWLLFAILFLWQFPHFLAIGWLYREDYMRAGVRMLPVIEPDGCQTGRQIVVCLAALLPVSLLPAPIGMSGAIYLAGAAALSLAFLYLGIRLVRQKSKWHARQLLLGSVLYLPLLFGLMVLNSPVGKS